MKLYMFRTVRLSIIRSLFTVHSGMVICHTDSFRTGPGWNPSWSCSKVVYKPVLHIPLLRVQWINSWWWTRELSETSRVSWQSKFVKLVHLVGFIKRYKWTISHSLYINILRCVQSMLKLFYLTILDATPSLVRLNYAANMEVVGYI